MVNHTWIAIFVILGSLTQTVNGYSCRYVNRHGVLIYIRCPYSECCGHYHYRYCCSTYPVGAVVGGVIGFIIFVALIVGCISCFFCACCPVYQSRSPGYVVARPARAVPNYSSIAASQPYQSTVVTRTAGGIQTSTPPPQYKP